jgi:hypothetical protein
MLESETDPLSCLVISQSSLSHRPTPIGGGTEGQATSKRDSLRDKRGKFSLKALTNQRLSRDRLWDKHGTDAPNSCPNPPMPSGQTFT